MKYRLIFLVSGWLFAACSTAPQNNEQTKSTNSGIQKIEIDTLNQLADTILLDGTDTAILVKGKPVKDDMGDKRADYVISIYFPHRNWPTLVHHQAIGAKLFLAGDLNNDQQPELLLCPEWFSSCWASVNLYSLPGSNWKNVASGNIYFCAENYPLEKRIIKTGKGYALLTDSITNDRLITFKKNITF